MSPDALLTLKRKLPKGYREMISKSTNLSVSTIDRVFNGSRSDQRVIDIALSMAEDAEQVRQLNYDRLNSIIRSSQ
ncbi:MAG: hypothetical protein WC699_16155 [Bacteroidales bacterium]|jgi:hypothetical protein